MLFSRVLLQLFCLKNTLFQVFILIFLIQSNFLCGSFLPPPPCATTLDMVQVVVHDTFYERQCTMLEDQKCTTKHIPSVEDRTETRCVPAFNTKCKKVVNTVYRKSCMSMYEKECREMQVTVYKTMYVAECTAGSCHKVAKQVPSIQPRQKCSSVKKEKCKDVPEKVEERKCFHIPTLDCVTVPVKVPVTVPQQKCHPVKRKHCQTIPVKRPRLVSKTVPRKVCGADTNIATDELQKDFKNLYN